jgi:hypothetical protein
MCVLYYLLIAFYAINYQQNTLLVTRCQPSDRLIRRAAMLQLSFSALGSEAPLGGHSYPAIVGILWAE